MKVTKSEVLSLRVYPDTKKKLIRNARRNKLSQADYIDRLIIQNTVRDKGRVL